VQDDLIESSQIPKKQADILKSLSKTELDVKIVMVEQEYSIGELISLSSGSVLNFKSGVDTPSWLAINGKKFAFGQVVQVGEKFGFQVNQLNEESH